MVAVVHGHRLLEREDSEQIEYEDECACQAEEDEQTSP
jgi:hypothetical protein